MRGDPIHCVGQAAHCCTRGNDRAINHDDGKAKRARCGDLGHGAFAARVLGNDDVDGMVTQQISVAGHGERSACDGQGGVWQGQGCGRRIDKAEQVVMLGLAGECVQMLPPDGKKYLLWLGTKGKGCGSKVWHMRPAVSRRRQPRCAFQRQQGDARGVGGKNGICADLGREGMRGVNDVGNRLGRDIGLQAYNAAKAADTGRQGLGHGQFGAASVGIDGIGVVIMQGAGQKASFARAAQKKDAHGV